MEKEISKKMTSKWVTLIAHNKHTECFLSIAEHFGYKDLVDKFKKVKKEHDAKGYLEYDVYINRYEILDELTHRIFTEYDRHTYQQVIKCL